MAVVVYTYGCPSWVEWSEEAQRQLRLAHDMRNDLVEIERQHDAARAAIRATDAEVVAAQHEADETGAALGAARGQVIQQGAERGNRAQAGTQEQIREAKERHKAAKARLARARKAADQQLKWQLRRADGDRKAAVSALYAEYVQGGGLFWATHHDVRKHYETLRKQVIAQRKQGYATQMRFQPWTGEGTLTVQLQRDSRPSRNQPRRSPPLLASGQGPWRNVAQLRPWVDPQDWASMPRAERRRTARGELDMKLNSHGGRLRLPVVIHRMLPAEADIAEIRVTRRRVGAQMRTAVHVTAYVPDPPTRTAGPAVGVDLGWRALDDGTLRVATIRATDLLPPPPEELPVVPVESGWEVRLPAGWRDLDHRLGAVQSKRDTAREGIRDELVAWLQQHPDADGQVDAATVRQWTSPARFASLAMAWRDAPPAGGEDLAGRLEAWRRQDKHLWEWHAHERDQLTRRRNDAYRKIAAWLADAAGAVAINATNYGALARSPTPEEDDSPQARRGRANRRLAAPSRLRHAVHNAATRRGVPVHLPDSTATSTHHECGQALQRTADWMEHRLVTCPNCEASFDQDHSAAIVLARHADACR